MFFFKFRHHFLQETYLPLLRVGCWFLKVLYPRQTTPCFSITCQEKGLLVLKSTVKFLFDVFFWLLRIVWKHLGPIGMQILSLMFWESFFGVIYGCYSKMSIWSIQSTSCIIWCVFFHSTIQYGNTGICGSCI